MTQIKAVLIDDEQRARDVLVNLLNRATTNINIISTCRNLEEGVKKIKELQPDVVFLDVQMPNYVGYEIVKFFDKIDFEIIFVTAYDQYAIKAFELNAIDYLVKPIDRTKLNIALEKLEEKLKQKNQLIDYQSLLKTIKDKNYKKIVIPELGNRHIVDLKNIVAIEASGAYSIIHLKENKQITTSKNLKYFEEIFLKELSFFRSHRGWIINLNFVELLHKTDLLVTLANGSLKAKISRNKIEDFEKVLK
ncbi:response regulator [uncultured Tenacibaculum sp.]|uniref:LytR/AlgR family response regulator transcription factor n=1 Tax=uncultured Tenacibaculum sp. TaxID=174713 RepID=UPI0026370818|nr:response regulator [uncultured Tenacibaculum sp.]